MDKDEKKVVVLRPPSPSNPIHPKTLADMTEFEQDAFIREKRERRLRAAQVVREAQVAKAQLTSLAVAMKIEKKIEQVVKQMERVDKAIEKMEELTHQLRALRLQHEDVAS